uniref:Uncharacterized protein n=1 Tax=viral metagenome TaxID=1070528 RepID=A0A6C0I6G7_9ZZZZ
MSSNKNTNYSSLPKEYNLVDKIKESNAYTYLKDKKTGVSQSLDDFSASFKAGGIQYLDQINEYKIYLFGLAVIILVIIMLIIFNPFKVTSNVIYIIVFTIIFFLCAGILGKMFINSKKGIEASQSNFLNKTSIIGAIISFIIILIIIFSEDFKKQKALTLNYCILFAVLSLLIIAYFITTKDDTSNMLKLPRNAQLFYSERTKFTTIFVLYILVISLLYFYNPWNIMTEYLGVSTFLIATFGLIFFFMIFVYHYFLINPAKWSSSDADTSWLQLFTKSIYVIAAFGISGLLLYGLVFWLGAFDKDSYSENHIGKTILNYVMLIGMLAIIWKLANIGGYLEKSPIFSLIINTILYIPCIIVDIFDYLTGQYKQTKQTEMMMLLLGLALFGGYFLIKIFLYPYFSNKFYGQGGKSWVNEPIPTDKQANVASYQELNANVKTDASITANDSDLQNTSEKYNYKYAISFWFYLDSFPPSTSSAYNKVNNLVSYGDNPCVKYDAVHNTLLITVKNDGDTRISLQKPNKNIKEGFSVSDIKNKIENVKTMPVEVDLDDGGNRIIYKQPNVLLQKWNNIVLNYNGGTLDVFYNGKLVKSAIEVVPYMKFDMLTVGSNDGVSGNVANLVYFDTPVNYMQIHTIYESLKDSNPPIIPDAGKNIVEKITGLFN